MVSGHLVRRVGAKLMERGKWLILVVTDVGMEAAR